MKEMKSDWTEADALQNKWLYNNDAIDQISLKTVSHAFQRSPRNSSGYADGSCLNSNIFAYYASQTRRAVVNMR